MIKLSKILASLPQIQIELASRLSLDQALLEICKLAKKFIHCQEVNIYSLDHLNEELVLSATSSKKKGILINNKNHNIKMGENLIGECAQLNRIINRRTPENSFHNIQNNKTMDTNRVSAGIINQSLKAQGSLNMDSSANCVLIPIRNINGTVDGNFIFNNKGVLEAKNKTVRIDGLPVFSTTDEGILELISLITHSFMHPKGKKAKNMILLSNLRNILSISNQLFLHDEISEIVHYSERHLLKLLNAERVRIFLKDISFSVKETTHFDKKVISLCKTRLDKKDQSLKGFYFDLEKKKTKFNLMQGMISKAIKTGQIRYVKDVFNEPDYNGTK